MPKLLDICAILLGLQLHQQQPPEVRDYLHLDMDQLIVPSKNKARTKPNGLYALPDSSLVTVTEGVSQTFPEFGLEILPRTGVPIIRSKDRNASVRLIFLPGLGAQRLWRSDLRTRSRDVYKRKQVIIPGTGHFVYKQMNNDPASWEQPDVQALAETIEFIYNSHFNVHTPEPEFHFCMP